LDKDPDTTKLIDILLAEHKAVREDASQAMRLEMGVLGIGIGSIIFNFFIQPSDSIERYAGLIAISLFTLLIWQRETVRWKRASWFMWRLERHINRLANVAIIDWEETLKKANKDKPIQMRSARHYSRIITATLLSAISWFVAKVIIIIFNDSLNTVFLAQPFHPIFVVLLAIFIIIYIFLVQGDLEKYDLQGDWPTNDGLVSLSEYIDNLENRRAKSANQIL
jgi:hypothetical protein